MKKKILSIALSSVMFFTGVQPIAANASEPFVIYDKEDLMAALALTSEEIGELSEEALAFYNEGISCYTKTVLMFGGDREMTEQYISVVATEELKTAYRESTGSEEFTFTPEFIEFAECCELSDFNDGGVTYENGYANYHFVYTEEYSEYTNADFYATIYTMLCMSPYLQYVCYEMPGAGSTAEESASICETYTFEEFLTLSEDTVCVLSDDIADTYTSYKELGEKESTDSGSEWNMPSFWLLLTDDMLTEIKDVYSTQGDFEGTQYVCDAMGVPMEMMDVVPGFMDFYNSGTKLELMRLSIDAREYNGVVSAEEITAKTAVWLKQNPGVSEVYLEYGVGELLTPDEAAAGDINMDGKISVLDVITLSKYNSQIIALNDSQLQAADCNADGVIDSSDLTSLMSYLVGLSESLPGA